IHVPIATATSKPETTPHAHHGATTARDGTVVSGERTRTYQNRNVQHVRATAGFSVGIPTCDTTITPASAPRIAASRRLPATRPGRRAIQTATATAQAIH